MASLAGIGGGGLFSGGMPMGKFTLQLLTLFPPTGLTGLNLAAAGLPIASTAKAAVFGCGALLGVYAKAFYAEFFTKTWRDCHSRLRDYKNRITVLYTADYAELFTA